MKRNDAEQIGKLIQQYLRQESLESPLNEQRLLDAWPQVLGPAASYTSNLYVRNHLCCPSSGTDDGAGVVGAYSESEGRGYGYYKHYFSLRKGILSVTFIPSFRSVSFARS